jgi:hypothetical protein
LQERVLIPDALLATYAEHPRDMAEVLAVEWRVPSAELIPIMARLIIRDDLYAVRPTINALAVVTEANVAGAAAELGCSLDDELAGRLTDLFRDLWTDKPGSLLDKLQQKDLAHFADGYVPKAELEALLARMSMSEKELEKWLGALLAAVGREHVRRNLITAIERSKADDRSGCLAILDALIQTYPGFAPPAGNELSTWTPAANLARPGMKLWQRCC